MSDDPSTLMSLVALAGQALPFVKSIADITGDAKIKNATSQLFDRLLAIQKLALDGQQATAEMQQKIAQITAELDRYRDWETLARSYQLHETAGGSILFAKNRKSDTTEPMHYLCPNCFSKREQSFLQPGPSGRILYCKPCDVEFYLERPQMQSGGSFGGY